MNTANMKIKLTQNAAKLVLLQKLKQKGVGLNEVEELIVEILTSYISNAS